MAILTCSEQPAPNSARSLIADWQLPPGVSRALWEYTESGHIAEQYDDYFAYNRLFEFDERLLLEHFGEPTDEPGVIADLGCGTGRALLPLVRRGFRGLAIDLSQRMLEVVARKAKQQQLSIDCLRANLVELQGVADATVSHAMCLFSTLGMIRGGDNRQQALQHAFRILKPRGRFIVHVHNYWFNLYDPGGPWIMLRNWCGSLFRPDVAAGDREFSYRGVPNMFLHVFTRRELMRSLRRAGFRPIRCVALHRSRDRALRNGWLFPSLRANGWIAICEKPQPELPQPELPQPELPAAEDAARPVTHSADTPRTP